MSSVAVSDDSRWYAIHTHPRQEERTDNNLQLWRVETLSPKLIERRYNKYSDKPIKQVKPLFPGYIFARFDAGRMLRKICYTRGLHSVVGFAGGPVPISDAVIEMIRSRVGEDGFVHIGEKLRAGDSVVIDAGPFKSLTGVFERELSDGERVKLLLATVLYQGHIIIDRGHVSKARQAPHCV
jgi:transcriptional antiterminator RfaH